MSNTYGYTSMDRVFSKLIRDYGEDWNEGDVIEWTGEALEFMQAVKSYEEAIAFIEVKNHQCSLPSGIHAVIQVARNNHWSGFKKDILCPITVTQSILLQNTEEQAAIPVALDCEGMPINDYELAYYRPYFDLQAEYLGWRHSRYYNNGYSPVRLATHTFFNNFVCSTEDDNPGITRDSGYDEYTVVDKKLLRFSFKEGSVAVAYLRQKLDPETGYPMIPDHVTYTTAIVSYIILRLTRKEFNKGREGSAGRLQEAEREWQWYCKQAGNLDMMPHGVDEHQNLLDQRSYILPRVNNYYSYFGKMSRPEGRKYNDPDGRNWKGFYFRGN